MISIVLYGRNDNYGYNLPKRAALGLNCMAEVLTEPDDEIVFVDYNTPDDFPTFPEAIADTLTEQARRRLRIFRVRPEQHAAFARQTHLQTVEPVARNVAVRRANPANRWILSTNTEMIFVPRQGRSLSAVVADLPRGFYATPRFEIPESLWESWDRHDPAGVLDAVARWGRHGFLNEVAYSTGVMFNNDTTFLYDAPGDFQLVEREDLVAIDGFDESMVLGWHVDSNLFRRLSLLYQGAPTSDLIERVHAYHCTHTRQLTPAHKHDAPRNDLNSAYFSIKVPSLPSQRKHWGLATEDLEEISLVNPPTKVFVNAVQSVLGAEDLGESLRKDNRIDYDPRHVLPFLLNVFVSAPDSLGVTWVGTEREMLDLFQRTWREMGFGGPIYLPTELVGALGADLGDEFHAVDLLTAFMRADAVIFDFAQRVDLDANQRSKRNEWLRLALDRFCHLERLRLETEDVRPRRVVAINAFYNQFERQVRDQLACTLTPFCTRIRTGFVSHAAVRERRAARNDVLVIVPTRSRPHATAAFAESFLKNSTRSDLVFALDDDDPRLAEYVGIEGAQYELNPRLHVVGTLNLLANKFASQYDYLAFMSDNHQIESAAWDQQLVAAIATLPYGIAYPNDIASEGSLPSAVLMRSRIVQELGFMVPPALIHGFRAEFWRDLGLALGSLRYCERVTIEHRKQATEIFPEIVVHPELAKHKVEERDFVAYEFYARTRLQFDVERLRLAESTSDDIGSLGPLDVIPLNDWTRSSISSTEASETPMESEATLAEPTMVPMESEPTSVDLLLIPDQDESPSQPAGWRSALRTLFRGEPRSI